jgi:hypothetical protein
MKKPDMTRLKVVQPMPSIKAVSWLGLTVADRCSTCSSEAGRQV